MFELDLVSFADFVFFKNYSLVLVYILDGDY